MKFIGWLTVIVSILVLGPIWTGYILSILWGWFMVPVFHVPEITIALAIGIGIVIRMLTGQLPEQKDRDSKEATEALIYSAVWTFLSPLIALIMGAIVHHFA